MSQRRRSQRQRPLDEVVIPLAEDELAELLLSAAERHEDVERMVRMAAARAEGDLSAVRRAVDSGLRTRRFLDYRESLGWAQAARPIIDELGQLGRTAPSSDLIELIQRAVGHVVKVILHADDSAGAIGTLAEELLDIHARACDAGVADPIRLSAWMVRFRFKDQDFFDPDPVRYATALGDDGLRAYRKAIDEASSGETFAVRYARQRLAVLDRDVDAIVRTSGGDLSHAGHFLNVAEAMAEIDRPDLVLEWTQRGIETTDGYQIGGLYELACRTHEQLGQPLEVLGLRRARHERTPSSSTYTALKHAATALDTWERERDVARTRLRDHDVRGYVVALLDDGDDDLAWRTAADAPEGAVDAALRLTVADRRAASHPADALDTYLAVVDEILLTTDRRAYSQAVRVLKQARTAARAAGRIDDFIERVAHLRDQHRRRPTLIAMLDKANLAA